MGSALAGDPSFSTTPAVDQLPHFADLLEVLALPDVSSGVVWHHSDANGALGVIDGGAVWATWARYLNGETEVRHGIEMIRAVWDEVREQYSRADLIERLLRDREERADELLSRCFVCCATVQIDSLSTYRGYRTYAIGIDVNQFTPTFHHAREQITAEVPDGIGWKMVAYTQAEKVERCHRLFSAWQLLLDSWPAERSLSIAAQVWVDALYELTVVHMKHESFADEREARYYAWSEPHDGHRGRRVSGNSIVPYVPLKLEAGSGIHQVRIGPGVLDGEAAAEALTDYLRERHGSEAQAVYAALPYR